MDDSVSLGLSFENAIYDDFYDLKYKL